MEARQRRPDRSVTAMGTRRSPKPGRQVELAEAADKPGHPANRDDGLISGWMSRNFRVMSLGRRDGQPRREGAQAHGSARQTGSGPV